MKKKSLKEILELGRIRNILIETSPSDNSNSGATLYEIEDVLGLGLDVTNGYTVKLYNAKLVRDEGEKLVATQDGLEYLQVYHEMKKKEQRLKNMVKLNKSNTCKK